MRWPVEKDFHLGKDQFGLDHSQVRRYTVLIRHRDPRHHLDLATGTD